MFKRTHLSRSLMLAFGASTLVMSGIASAQQSVELERVEVTGSSIKRVAGSTPAPVEVITQKDIARTGASSMNELMRSIASLDVFDQGELASNSPSGSGTASLKMRGLDSSNLLVLLNGRRLPVNGLYDSSGAGAAVDINMIPVAAIARIDILKDGGSAIYGADAVAGVINIITKPDYQGAEVTGGYGQASRGDAKEKHVGVTAGFGDLSKDRFNVLAGLDYFKRDPILRKDRDLTKSANFTPFGGGDGRSSFAPSGNVIDPNSGALVGVTYRDCPTGSLGGGNVCRYDFNQSILTSYNGADRVSGLLLGSFQATPDIKLFAEVMAARTKDTFLAQPVPDYFLDPITNENQRPYELLNADGSGTNQVYIAGRFMQGGPRTTVRKADLINTSVGAEGTTSGLDWKVSLSHGVSKVTNQDYNYFDKEKWYAATGSGELDPTVLTNDQAMVDGLKISPRRVGKSTIDTFNAQVGGDLVQMPAGPLQYAVGLQWLHEKLSDTPDEILQEGNEVGGIQQSAVAASRTVKSVYGELAVPLLKNLDAQLAARYDKYPQYSQTSPKVGLKYTVMPQLALRASYTKSFRAPVLKQLYSANEQGATTLTDPEDCAKLNVPLQSDGTCLINAYQVNGSNPNLKPEKGTTYNFGAVFDVAKNLSGSLDYWKIEKKDDIAQPSLSTAIDNGLIGHDGPRLLIFTNLLNFAQQQTSGIDMDLKWRFPGTALGTITLRDSATYYITNKTRDAAGDPWTSYNNTYANPMYRNVFTAISEMGPWTVTGALRSIGGFHDSDRGFPVAASARKVPSEHEFDLQAQYEGFKGFSITGGIKNLFDRMPPFSNQNASSNTYTQLGFAELYNVRGRFYYASVTYKFN